MKQADPGLQEIGRIWQEYLEGIDDWQTLIDGVEPKNTDCGPVYEIPNPIAGRANESFAIADMRELDYAKPHYHKGKESEIYIALQGVGLTVVGGWEMPIEKGSVVITQPGIAHFTLPGRDLVLAVINTPPFNPANAISVDEKKTNRNIGFDASQLARFKSQRS